MAATVPLGELAERITSGSRAWRSRLGSGSGRFLLAQCVRDGALDLSAAPAVDAPTDKEAERTRVRLGDILVTIVGDVGRVALVREDPGEAYVSQSVALIRTNGGVSPPYLEEYLRSPAHGQAYFEEKQYGVGRGHLLLSHLRELPVVLPPAEEQRRIVEVIESHGSRTRVATDTVRAAIAKLARYREVVLMTAITAQEHPQMLADGTCRVPAHWRWTRLGEIGDIVGGVTKDAKKESRPGLIEVPYLRVANVQRGYLDLTNVKTIRVTKDEVKALRLLPGDVLFNEGGDRDKLGRGWIWSGEVDSCIHQNHVFRARLRDAATEPRFVSWYANAMGQAFFFSHGRQTTNLASISKTQLAKLPIPLPPPEEQKAILSHIDRQLSVIDELQREAGVAVRRASALSRAILTEAMSGRLYEGPA